MSLKETSNDVETVYPDDEALSLAQWGEMLGVERGTLKRAVERGGAPINTSELGVHGRTSQKKINIEDFPKVIEGFRNTIYHGSAPVIIHPWAYIVNTAASFKITPPSGKKLQYVYDCEMTNDRDK